jgi:hypothetical protein
VTSITLLAIKRAEAKAGRKLSFAEAATPGTPHLELMLAGEMQWAMQQMFRQYDLIADLLVPSEQMPEVEPQPNRRRNRLAPNSPCSIWANDVMDLDKDDLAVLCRDMTKEEVDRVHRFLHEWGIGPEDSFPVQFVLLTRAQLRAAASVPRCHRRQPEMAGTASG